ncbi:endolysin [Bacillus phage vB_BanS_Nate]|uniref:N-acetylmuramoyl-L-alanine amidase n=1 Tax=Bacillus phage vB_BanS_Nate TaxID=2894788 RepID=A0AAE9CEL3_9CAUD|nr:endolysin [Bacillus phage vB_BanS_Nate]UGO51062.1 N-acetylmuramoyl-L-alanine amidase [Bacillus phage vB_BanS_Nate]
MAISVRQKMVDSSKYSLKCPNSMTAEYITIHNTYNDASANNEVQYMITNSNATSFHFAIDDFEVVQGIPTNRNAWHCGDGNGNGNRKSIGVEICYSMSGGDRYRKAEALAIKFVAQLLRERGWGIDRVKKHQDWSGKYCPHRILDEGRWQAVLNAIKAELNGGGTTQPPTSSTGVVKVVTTGLNLRTQPNASAPIIRQLGINETYQFWAVSNGWYNLGGDQWAYGDNGNYLQVISGGTVAPTPPQPKPVTGTAYITGYNVNMRTGAGTGYSVIRQLNAPESYKVWGMKDGWLNLGGDQWIKNDSSFVRFVQD